MNRDTPGPNSETDMNVIQSKATEAALAEFVAAGDVYHKAADDGKSLPVLRALKASMLKARYMLEMCEAGDKMKAAELEHTAALAELKRHEPKDKMGNIPSYCRSRPPENLSELLAVLGKLQRLGDSAADLPIGRNFHRLPIIAKMISWVESFGFKFEPYSKYILNRATGRPTSGRWNGVEIFAYNARIQVQKKISRTA